jgi:hypothetical protein
MAELEESLTSATRALTGLARDEIERRTAFKKEQILAVLDLGPNEELVGLELAAVLQQAAAVRAVSGLATNAYYVPGQTDQIAVAARSVLDNYAVLRTEMEKSL